MNRWKCMSGLSYFPFNFTEIPSLGAFRNKEKSKAGKFFCNFANTAINCRRKYLGYGEKGTGGETKCLQ